MINTYKNITEKQEERLRKFINKVFDFSENEKMNGVLEYNYETHEFDITPTLKTKDVVISKNDMKLLKHAFVSFTNVKKVIITFSINYNVLKGKIEWFMDDQNIDTYIVNSIRLKCNHINIFPFSNNDDAKAIRIEHLIEDFVNAANNDSIKDIHFVCVKDGNLRIKTEKEDIIKSRSSIVYDKYKNLVKEIKTVANSSVSLMFIADLKIKIYSVIIEETEYDENQEIINKKNETFLIDIE